MGLSIEHPAPSITFHGTVSIKHHLHVGGSNALVQCSQCRQPSTVQPRHPRRSRPCSTMPASGARVRGQLQARQVICYYSHHQYRFLGSLRASHLTVFLSYYACTNRDWHGIDRRVARVPPNERLRDHRGKVGRDLIRRRSAGTWCRQLTDSAICTYPPRRNFGDLYQDSRDLYGRGLHVSRRAAQLCGRWKLARPRG
jgi:hypothetical protein